MASDKSRLLVRRGWHAEVYLRLSGRNEETGGTGGQRTGPNVWSLNNLPAWSAGLFSCSRASFDLRLNHRIM